MKKQTAQSPSETKDALQGAEAASQNPQQNPGEGTAEAGQNQPASTAPADTETHNKAQTKGQEDALCDVDALISQAALPAWQGAALCRAENWAPGKQVTQAAFATALERLNSRRMGG